MAKLVNLAKIWAHRPLKWAIIHQRVMLEGPESPKSPHKLVLPENVSISAFYTVIMGAMVRKLAKLINDFYQSYILRSKSLLELSLNVPFSL